MRWKPVAAGAAGVVAAIGFGSQHAAADDEAFGTDVADRFAEVEAAQHFAATQPEGTRPVRPEVNAIALIEQPVATVGSGSLEPDATPDRAVAEVVTRPVKQVAETIGIAVSRALAAPQRPAAPAPPPAPVANPVDQTDPATTPVAPETAAVSVTKPTYDSTAAPTTAVAPATRADGWVPAEIAHEADRRISERYAGTPVRGPPPSTASALGNDGRTTIYQVAVVKGPDGFAVSIAAQDVEVNNLGVAVANASGGGSATATGDKADTSVTQVSLVVQRGTGTATVKQNAKVDNIGIASATSAGAANSTAVGNASSTSVNQVAVVIVEGSGSAHVSQTATVGNVGVASATGGTATGNASSTDVTQVAVVHVGDQDVALNQTSTTTNLGVATATGGTATGNAATTSVVQMTKAGS